MTHPVVSGHLKCVGRCMLGWLWAGLFLLGFAHGSALAKSWTGQVMHVSDGDTLWVQPDHGGEARKLRLAALDAPERCQLWGQQAWRALHTRLLGQPVQVESGRLDTYGRLLAHVWHQGQDVGAWMVAQGHAWSPTYRGLPGPYDALQRQAQWLRRGLFAHPLGLMPPREFRRWHGSC
ncbi:MAG: thermonuclease family protein [Limnohabitans sp.]